MIVTRLDKFTYIRTIGIILIWISYGMSSLVPGSTLTDLAIQLKLPYRTIALGIAFRGIGILIGAPIGGKVVDNYGHVKNSITISAVQMLASVLLVVIPWIPQTTLLLTLFVAVGICCGILNVVTVDTIFQTWREKSQRVLPLVFMGRVFGGIIAPLLANPFLAQTNLMSTFNTSKYKELDNLNLTLSTNTTHVAQAYFLISSLCVALVIPYMVSVWYGRKLTQGYEDMNQADVKSENQNDLSQSSKDTKRNIVYFKLFATLVVFIFTFNNLGVSYTMGVFVRTLSIDLHGLSRDEASSVNALYFCGSIFGCMVSSLLAFFLSTQTILIVFTGLIFSFGIVFFTLGIPYVTAFWFSTFTIGVPSSGIQSLFMSYTKENIPANGIILSGFVSARGLSDLVYVALSGFLYDTVGPWVVPFLTMILFIVNTLVVIIFISVNLIRKTGKPV